MPLRRWEISILSGISFGVPLIWRSPVLWHRTSIFMVAKTGRLYEENGIGGAYRHVETCGQHVSQQIAPNAMRIEDSTAHKSINNILFTAASIKTTTEGLLFVESLINGPYSPAPFPKGARERLFANSESGKCQLFSHLTSHTAIAPSALDRRRLNSYTNLSNAIV